MKNNKRNSNIILTNQQHARIVSDAKNVKNAYKFITVISIFSFILVMILYICTEKSSEDIVTIYIAMICTIIFMIIFVALYISSNKALSRIKNKTYKVLQDKVVKKIVSNNYHSDSRDLRYYHYCKVTSYIHKIQFARDEDYSKVNVGDNIIIINAGRYKRAYVFNNEAK